ncbi:hypothetical protein LWI28_006071 [Acer negundo]|uniref:Major facilitator superfamily (MFS) profile domain-containing protein n=1 Tax=Acer negundo TaxID=4023 RepID=A0AAD5JLU0_ACENE|nr:hypothetical protein LWI28_006071 [Acer negundo]
MFVMRLHRLGIPLPGSEPRTPTTFVHGVHIMFKLKIEGSSQEIEVGSSQKFQESESLLKSTTPAKRIVYTSTRPTDIKTPYKKMLDNQVEFGSPDKRSKEYIISNCTELIEKHKGKLLVKEEPRVVSEWDDKLLAEHMAKLNQDNEEAVPLFISEISPAKYRGALNILFQLLITIGILIANLINYGTSKLHPYGWRVSLGGAAVPALILFFGSLMIVETPVSLIERGKVEEGLKTLKKIRGVENVDREFEEIFQATELAKSKSSFCSVFKKKSRPQLVCGICIMVLQQFTGINVIMFYAPVLFQTMGFGSDAALLSSVVTGLVNAVSTLIAIFTVDIFGRKALLIEGAFQMIVTQCATGAILKLYLKGTNTMPPHFATIVVGLVCVFVAGFAWSWGPLGWLISSEIFPLETRNAGYFFAVGSNMLCTFIIAQAFLTMLCHMKWGIFYFFAVWLVIAFTFTCAWMPETKGIPIDEMNERVWKKHWYWKKCFKNDKFVREIQTVPVKEAAEEEKTHE